MYTSALTTVLLSALTAAAPIAQGTITLQIGIAVQGDDATTRDIAFGKLVSNADGTLPPSSNIVVSFGDNVPISQGAITCQAFSDAAGTKKLGSTFNNVLPGTRLATAGSLVNIGSVFCSDAAGVAAFSTSSGSSTSVTEVNIELEFDIAEEGASVGTVPVNGKLIPVRGTFATQVANSASIQSTNGQQPVGVGCEAFGDAAGKQKIGVVMGNGDMAVFAQGGKDVPIGAFKCTEA